MLCYTLFSPCIVNTNEQTRAISTPMILSVEDRRYTRRKRRKTLLWPFSQEIYCHVFLNKAKYTILTKKFNARSISPGHQVGRLLVCFDNQTWLLRRDINRLYCPNEQSLP